MNSQKLRRSVLAVLAVVLAVSLVSVPPVGGAASAEGESTSGSRYVALASAERLVDTRTGTGVATALGPGKEAVVDTSNLASVPRANTTDLVIELTAVRPSSTTFLASWEDGRSKPNVSSLNAPANELSNNTSIVHLSAAGRFRLYNAAGSTPVVIDVVGYFSSTTGGAFTATTPTRVLDTRSGLGGAQTLAANASYRVPIDTSLIPADATSVFANVTLVNPSQAGYVKVGSHVTGGTNGIDFSAGSTSTASVFAEYDSNLGLSVVNRSSGSVNVILDVGGLQRST